MPTPANHHVYLQFWLDALADPRGIYITSPDVERLKTRLYKARADQGDPILMHLLIRTSPVDPKGQVWIIRKDPTEPEV